MESPSHELLDSGMSSSQMSKSTNHLIALVSQASSSPTPQAYLPTYPSSLAQVQKLLLPPGLTPIRFQALIFPRGVYVLGSITIILSFRSAMLGCMHSFGPLFTVLFRGPELFCVHEVGLARPTGTGISGVRGIREVREENH